MENTYHCYANRELSWLRFNERVLEEAEDSRLPLCERLSFLSIFQSNLDEFFMVRIGSLQDQMLLDKNARENKTNMTSGEQIDAALAFIHKLTARRDAAYNGLLEQLAEQGIRLLDFAHMEEESRTELEKLFRQDYLPLLSSFIISKKQAFPFLKNKGIYAVAVLSTKAEKKKIGIVPCGNEIFPRLVPVPGRTGCFILSEELILHFLPLLYKGYKVTSKTLARITRNADIDADLIYDEDLNYRDHMAEVVKKRKKLAPVRLELSREIDEEIIQSLCKNLKLDPKRVFEYDSPLDHSFLFQIEDQLRSHTDLFFAPRHPQPSPALDERKPIIPQILEEDFVVTDGASLCPEGPGYQALIVYQEEMPLSSAKKLLRLAGEGQKILFVNGVTEENLPLGGCTFHKKAASRTPYVMESDEKLREIVSEIKEFPGVMEMDGQTGVGACLEKMGVKPRAAFLEPNPQILTCMREDGDRRYVLVYDMQYTRQTVSKVSLCVEGGGRPYEADCWTGEIREISGTEYEGGTAVSLALNPGEATMLIFDRTEKPETLPEETIYAERELPRWNLQVESWTAGEKREISEERRAGIVTREVYYETKKTMIDAGETELIPWKDIPAVGKEVSGIGYYRTVIELPEEWREGDGARLCIGSTNGETAAVYVNGRKAPAYNINRRTVEIGNLLRAGRNELVVEVSSSLNNCLKAGGYYDTTFPNTVARMMGANNGNGAMEEAMAAGMSAGENASEDAAPGPDLSAIVALMTRPALWRDYGMTGKVSVLFYKGER